MPIWAIRLLFFDPKECAITYTHWRHGSLEVPLFLCADIAAPLADCPENPGLCHPELPSRHPARQHPCIFHSSLTRPHAKAATTRQVALDPPLLRPCMSCGACLRHTPFAPCSSLAAPPGPVCSVSPLSSPFFLLLPALHCPPHPTPAPFGALSGNAFCSSDDDITAVACIHAANKW